VIILYPVLTEDPAEVSKKMAFDNLDDYVVNESVTRNL
jgi:hypothetical protein